jgi:hypothetical protein
MQSFMSDFFVIVDSRRDSYAIIYVRFFVIVDSRRDLHPTEYFNVLSVISVSSRVSGTCSALSGYYHLDIGFPTVTASNSYSFESSNLNEGPRLF